MTETEWLTATEPAPLLQFLRDQASARKFRLFACACCRRIWPLLSDERSRQAVVVAERFADSLATEAELRSASAAAAAVGVGFGVQFSTSNAAHFAALPERTFADRAASAERCASSAARIVPGEAEPAAQAALARCLWGNPFHPPTLNPAVRAWNEGTAAKVAQSIYDSRRFADLPILADALEEAGCDHAEILEHCRDGGEHGRGCWVLDLVLARE